MISSVQEQILSSSCRGENMSEEMAMLPGRGIRVDSSQPQQQEITVDNNRQHIDELLEVIRGANGMPVLLLTSSDGRLSAIAMNGLQNMVPTNREVNGSTEKKFQDFRAWLLLITSLVATVTFTAGLSPPGGYWADDKDGHVAGTSVMRDKFSTRYRLFEASNSYAFFFSLMIIATLATNADSTMIRTVRNYIFPFLVFLCFFCFGGSFLAGTWESHHRGVRSTIGFVVVLFYMAIHWVPTWFRSRPSGQRPADTNNS